MAAMRMQGRVGTAAEGRSCCWGGRERSWAGADLVYTANWVVEGSTAGKVYCGGEMVFVYNMVRKAHVSATRCSQAAYARCRVNFLDRVARLILVWFIRYSSLACKRKGLPYRRQGIGQARPFPRTQDPTKPVNNQRSARLPRQTLPARRHHEMPKRQQLSARQSHFRGRKALQSR